MADRFSDFGAGVVRRRPRRRALAIAIIAATCAYLTWLVITNRSELDRALLRFQGAEVWWLVGAIGLEVVAQGASVFVQRRLLRRAGSTIGLGATARLVLAQNAMTLALPGGQAVAAGFAYGQLRRRGTDAAAASWAVGTFNVMGMLALVAFAAVTTAGVTVLSMLTAVVLATVLVVLVMLTRWPQRLMGPTEAVFRLSSRLRPDRSGRDPERDAGRWLASFTRVKLAWHDWVVLGAMALGAVAADCAVWVCASHAVITLPARCSAATLSARVARQCATFHVPSTPGLFIAYAAGQGALALPLLPGGIGLVESVMTATLTAAKVRSIAALSAVLLYRFISFWSVVLIGMVCWLSMRRSRRHLLGERGSVTDPTGTDSTS